jgi:hypothetical protein
VVLAMHLAIPSLSRLWRGGFSPTLCKDMAFVVLIKLGQPSP